MVLDQVYSLGGSDSSRRLGHTSSCTASMSTQWNPDTNVTYQYSEVSLSQGLLMSNGLVSIGTKVSTEV